MGMNINTRKKRYAEAVKPLGEMYIEDRRLEKFGENSAKTAYADSYGQVSAKPVIRKLSRNMKKYRKLTVKVESFTSSDLGNIKSYLPSEFSWVCENAYMILKEGKAAKKELAGKYRLPASGTEEEYPGVYLLAADFLKTGAGNISPERLKLFLAGAQKTRVLRENEFNLFIPMLKCAAIAAITNIGNDIQKIIDGYRLSENESGVNPYYSEMEIWRSYEQGGSPDKKTLMYSRTAEKMHEILSESLKNYFNVLRIAGDMDFVKALRESSWVERTLEADPTGVYAGMDDDSKAYYRHLISITAKRKKTTEYELSRSYLEKAKAENDRVKRHVGYYIVNNETITKKKKAGGRAYLILDILLPIAASVALGIIFGSFWLSLGVLLPLWELSRSLLLYIFIKKTRPICVPALALTSGIPPEGKTLCVITILADDEKSVMAHMEDLEKYYLSNRDARENIYFGVLADFPDADKKSYPEDGILLEKARATVDALNGKYGRRFCFIHRERVYNDRERKYIGRERKRGAIESLCALIRQGSSESICYGIDSGTISGIAYLITLDADTKLMPGSVVKMVGAMLHPLNAAVVDKERKIVVSGYGVLQPRVSVELRAANASLFSRIYAGQGGTDPYCSISGDIYQNLFAESIFIGKGIIDVSAMYDCLYGTIPDNAVLSHDLLEGCFLRTAFLSNTELPDGFPSSVRAYFKRAGRWIRGDIQIIPWLFPTVRTKNGKMKNPLSGLSKFKIVDNLRRSVTAIICLVGISLYAIILSGAAAAFAVCSLAALSAPLILNCVERINNFGNKVNTRYHSTIYAGFRGGLMLFVSRFLFVPFEAWTELKSVSKSFWRMIVSKRKLLEWTTAAEAEKYRSKGIAGEYLILLPICVSGAVVVLLGMNPVSAVLAVFWLLTPLYSRYISNRITQKILITSSEREYLTAKAREIWSFFNDFLSKYDNFLPPDNYQEEPCGTIAHRTSPTNIGLALLSVVTARKLQFIDEETALRLMENIVNTVQKLKKFKGHLYNWYDTQTLDTLCPETISSVDSGNFAACLLITAAALREYKSGNAKKLAGICRALFDDTDFKIMYDDDNQLLRISLSPDHKNPGGYYDMLASEARLTSYIAIAKGDVPSRHWKRLSRLLSEQNGYSGLVSWSGSCFEYLMPNIIMPEMPNSLIYESNRYAVYCQRLRARSCGTPWGISESCYFAFDSALNYQYKAHGVASIALKAGVNEELVVSPYSTYLALVCEPQKAVENLRALDALGVSGRYGFYEAVDYTAPRLPSGERYKTVKAYMTHHLGMSLCAIGNALTASENGGYLCDLFLDEPLLSSCESLLCERVPVNAINITALKPKPSSKKTQSGINNYSQIIDGYNVWLPPCNISSNRRYSVLAAASGVTRSTMGDILIYRADCAADARLPGIVTLVKTSENIFSVTDLPRDGAEASRKTIFTSQGTKYTADCRTLSVTETVRVSPGEPGEQREIYIQNRGESREEITLCFYFEPVLSSEADYQSHPDFTKMFISTRQISGGALIMKKNRSGGPNLYLVALCDTDAKFTTVRKAIIGRNGVTDISVFFENEWLSDFGQVRDAGVRVLAKIAVEPKTDRIVRLALSCGANAENTENSARRILLLPEKNNADAFLRKAISLGLDASAIKEAIGVLPCLFYEPYARRYFAERITGASVSRAGLWKLGISGDLPIGVLSYDDFLGQDEFIKAIFRYIRLHALLSAFGADFDLAIICADGGDYDRPEFNACFSAIKITGSDRCVGRKGGIHLFDVSRLQKEEVDTLYSAASFVLPPANWDGERPPIEQDELSGRGRNPSLNPRIHSVPCANTFFGFTGADCGLLHMWCANSRLFKLTPWENDVLLPAPAGEDIRLWREGRSISVFCRNDGYRSSVKFEPNCVIWQKQFDNMKLRTTAFVHPKLPARVVKLELDGTSDEPVELVWMLRPVFGEKNVENRRLITAYDETLGAITVQNPFADDFNPRTLALCVNPKPAGFTCDYPSYKQRSFDGKCGRGLLPCVAFRIVLTPVGGKAAAYFTAAISDGENAKEIAASLSDRDNASKTLDAVREATKAATETIKINTPDTRLNSYINDWSAWQIIGSRLYSKSSIYQNGGAYGFRDQLQDVSALVLTKPELLKIQIYRACARQYEEGDVMHWFHAGMRTGSGAPKGVRTLCSDDLLWLVRSVTRYVETTGDESILKTKIRYIKSEPLDFGERERYENAEPSPIKESVFSHCVRAIEQFEKRGRGEHGLPKILGGDWNDGFNRLGENGRGESVWLAWFASETVLSFSSVCGRIGEKEYAKHLKELASELAQAAGNAWDGGWFRRGYDDFGRPVGSEANAECKIDSVAQSFSVFCEAYGKTAEEREKIRLALKNASERLIDRENMLIRLFTPPIVTTREYGYISAYPPGVRENGGQYTHAAVWLASAMLRARESSLGYQMLKLLLPAYHDPEKYEGETFVLSADVYGYGDLTGKCGWSWYTGAAGWYRRTVVEDLLGITLKDGMLRVSPNVPGDWPGYECELRYGNSRYIIRAVNTGTKTSAELSLTDDGETHEVNVFF